MVWVEPGTFLMGRYYGEVGSYPHEDPQHEVTISQGFWMAKYEFTKRQWMALLPDAPPWLGQDYVLDDPDSPAVWVSWEQAKQCIDALNAHILATAQGPATMRLPSEAEWEYACRAGTTTRFYWGDDLDETQISDYAWWRGNAWDVSEEYAHVVGQKLPNLFGLYDMTGNAFEWCEDDYHSGYAGAPTDGSAWVDSPRHPYRIRRGGAWSLRAQDGRSARRHDASASQTFYTLGFRVCR